MDPDREALKRALDKAQHPWLNLDHQSVSIDTKQFYEIRDAARRDLARLEGEKPKRASLGELVELLGEAGRSGVPYPLKFEPIEKRSAMFEEAAAVLRAVGELKVGNLGLVDFMRGLP